MLFNYYKKYKYSAILSLIMSLVVVWSILYQPSVLKDVINALNEISNGNKDAINELNKYGFYMIAAGIIGLVSGVANTLLSAKLAQKIGADIRSDAFNKIQDFRFSDIEKFNGSNLVVRMTNDVTQVQNYIMIFFQMVIRIPLIFVLSFILAIYVLPQLWYAIIIYVVTVIGVMGLIMKILTPAFKGMQESTDDINQSVKTNLTGIRVVKSFVTEKIEETKLRKKVDSLTNYVMRIGFGFSVLIPVFVFVANIVSTYVLYYIAEPAIDNIALIGDVISFTNYLLQIMFAVMMLGFLGMILGRAGISIKRLGEVLDYEIKSTKDGIDFESGAGEIEFKDVEFTYPNSDEPTLKNINLTIAKGSSVGIVGSTGSGKTTLVNLISRIYDVSKGELKINKLDINSYSQKAISNNISLVLQKPQIISGTISEVIMSGNLNASNDELISASKNAQAFEFINKLEKGFDSEVLQHGNNFSGGQKQRLSIARGFIKNPSILILDDSTSALDAKSENLVKKAIREQYTNMTKVIVAQKISSVVDLDQIVVMNDGEIEAIGTHKSLLECSETYREIYETQKAQKEVTNEQ